jgi:hypothetical protein
VKLFWSQPNQKAGKIQVLNGTIKPSTSRRIKNPSRFFVEMAWVFLTRILRHCQKVKLAGILRENRDSTHCLFQNVREALLQSPSHFRKKPLSSLSFMIVLMFKKRHENKCYIC